MMQSVKRDSSSSTRRWVSEEMEKHLRQVVMQEYVDRLVNNVLRDLDQMGSMAQNLEKG